MKRKILMFILSAFLLNLLCVSGLYSQARTEKHRMIVLTDIEADPDDSQTMVRLLLYSNVIDLEGLIATTSTHQRTRVAPESILKLINAYEKVQPNLLKHEEGFPTASELRSLVKQDCRYMAWKQ
jgi:hypothetical protein